MSLSSYPRQSTCFSLAALQLTMNESVYFSEIVFICTAVKEDYQTLGFRPLDRKPFVDRSTLS